MSFQKFIIQNRKIFTVDFQLHLGEVKENSIFSTSDSHLNFTGSQSHYMTFFSTFLNSIHEENQILYFSVTL